MFETKQQALRNGLTVTKGDYPLYRDFGLSGVDAPSGVSRAELSILLSTYYPDIRLSSVTIASTQDELSVGHFKYTVEVGD